ncbi:MAG: hypothetical protein M3P04_10785, partial [Actinomycetota bacterium]|nr:hypothetical protein [Actinomycetota bacterium]
ADVDPDDTGGLGMLRLDLEAGVDEAAVASQVSRVLRDQFGLGVDADRVELVEVAPSAPDLGVAKAVHPKEELVEEPVEEAVRARPDVVAETAPVADVSETVSMSLPAQRTSRRPSIAKLHLVSTDLDVTASVTLASGTRTAVGEARGAASQSGVHRAVASATLRAVEELVGGAVRIELEHLEVTTMGSERTVLVTLTLLTRQGSEPLTGAAGVRDDVRQAVIRATLDALNRRLELLLSEA